MEQVAKRFKAPAGVKDIKSVVIKELSTADEIAAAVEADLKAGKPGFRRDNFAAMMKLERMEKIRASIAAVNDKPVPPGPFAGYDRFSARTKLWLGRCHDDLNGLDEEELEKSVAGAEVVDLNRPITEAPASEEPEGG